MRFRASILLAAIFIAAGLLATACNPSGSAQDNSLTVYSSRAESLVHPLLEQFARDTGIDIRVRYDTTASVVSTIMEEGRESPADVVYLAESSGLGALSQASFLAKLPDNRLNQVDARFRSSKGEWVGVSGRAKILVYNTRTIVPERDLPPSVMDFTDPKWRGRLGWAPTHGEWQLLVTSIRLTRGEAAARAWLEGIKANQPRTYPNLISIVQGAADGEIDVGFVNHYYVPRFLKERGPSFGARNHYITNGDPGGLIDVAGVAVLAQSKHAAAAARFVEYMLSAPAQHYFAEQTYEYPLSAGVSPVGELPPLATLNPPKIDPDQLADLQGTLRLLRETGIIP
jgi:iron(III) transport system substrate-binding protein